METTPEQPLALRPRAAARLLGLSTAALEKMRLQNRGPLFVRADGGRAIFYTFAELQRWLHQGELAELQRRNLQRIRSRR